MKSKRSKRCIPTFRGITIDDSFLAVAKLYFEFKPTRKQHPSKRDFGKIIKMRDDEKHAKFSLELTKFLEENKLDVNELFEKQTGDQDE